MELKTFFRKGENLFSMGVVLILAVYVVLYVGPIFWMIIGYFFTPKILKDARKLQEEQDLTI